MQAKFPELLQAIAGEIRSGRIASGTRMPTHRDFAWQRGIALSTATRVYRELARMGLVTGETGRGTYARAPQAVRDLGMVPADVMPPDIIDLTRSHPLLPEQPAQLREALAALIGPDAGALEYLSYKPHAGGRHERELFAGWLRRERGVTADPSQIVATQGGQHGIALSLLVLCRPGDRVACEALTYPGIAAAAAMLRVDLVPIETDAEGLVPAALARACKAQTIRALYCMPTVQNPLGGVLPVERREQLVQIARRHDLTIVEDGSYAFLAPGAPPPLLAMAPERTVYLDSFAKLIAPGLRVGFLVAPPDRVAGFTTAIRATTWSAMGLATALAARWIQDGTAARLRTQKRALGARIQRLVRQQLDGLQVTAHPNGFFAWVRLPAGWRADEFAVAANRDGFAVTPARAFAADPRSPVPEAVRIGFGSLPEDRLREGLRRLRVLAEAGQR